MGGSNLNNKVFLICWCPVTHFCILLSVLYFCCLGNRQWMLQRALKTCTEKSSPLQKKLCRRFRINLWKNSGNETSYRSKRARERSLPESATLRWLCHPSSFSLDPVCTSGSNMLADVLICSSLPSCTVPSAFFKCACHECVSNSLSKPPSPKQELLLQLQSWNADVGVEPMDIPGHRQFPFLGNWCVSDHSSSLVNASPPCSKQFVEDSIINGSFKHLAQGFFFNRIIYLPEGYMGGESAAVQALNPRKAVC